MNIWFFSIFQSVSAFTNTGMSMADLSLIPFQDAHLMNLCECTRYFLIVLELISTVVAFLIILGNTSYVSTTRGRKVSLEADDFSPSCAPRSYWLTARPADSSAFA